jgi:hypothetical protein
LNRNHLESPDWSTSYACRGKKEIELEIVHLLFIDIVAYSKLSINEQFRKAEAQTGS